MLLCGAEAFSYLELTLMASWFAYMASVIYGQCCNTHSGLVMGGMLVSKAHWGHI